MVQVASEAGRRVRVTADHPFIVGTGEDEQILTLKAARDLDDSDWLPLSLGGPPGVQHQDLAAAWAALLDDELVPVERVLVRPPVPRSRP